MRIVVTGSLGHLGEALVRVLGSEGHAVAGLDVLDSPHTNVVGSVSDRDCVRRCVEGMDATCTSRPGISPTSVPRDGRRSSTPT